MTKFNLISTSLALVVLSNVAVSVRAFMPHVGAGVCGSIKHYHNNNNNIITLHPKECSMNFSNDRSFSKKSSSSSSLSMAGNGDIETSSSMSESEQVLLGALGTFAALVTFYSEFTLKTTGCGLPAGPFGLVGLVEGLSYLGVTGLAVYSIVTKVKTGSGLPAGPGGLLGAAEGLSFLAIVAGLVVLALQITNFGYIPNAVPMEGGMCS